uniref:Methionine adenosyltransferase n=1 Tax=Catharus ustulatus TaxID=91951 RepID=A0A8C3Y5U7_CATUS
MQNCLSLNTCSKITAKVFYYPEIILIISDAFVGFFIVPSPRRLLLCDKLSDAVLDAHLRIGPDAKVAYECVAKTGLILLWTEMTSQGIRIEYDDSSKVRLYYKTCTILVVLEQQGKEIKQAISHGKSDDDIVAGDRGLMFGYATDETEEYPSKADHSVAYAAHWIAKSLVKVRATVKVIHKILTYKFFLRVHSTITASLQVQKIFSHKELLEIVQKSFDLCLRLYLKRPIYEKTACYGHFGREEFTWEILKKPCV